MGQEESGRGFCMLLNKPLRTVLSTTITRYKDSTKTRISGQGLVYAINDATRRSRACNDPCPCPPQSQIYRCHVIRFQKKSYIALRNRQNITSPEISFVLQMG
jgi:hypothetical protein